MYGLDALIPILDYIDWYATLFVLETPSTSE